MYIIKEKSVHVAALKLRTSVYQKIDYKEDEVRSQILGGHLCNTYKKGFQL